MIKADRIGKTFNQAKRVVDDVSFEVALGETLVLLGTSGSGKTTTLRMINRLIEPSSGQLFIGGKNVRAFSGHELRRGIGYVLQDSGLFPHYTVAENIAVVPELLGWGKERTRRRTHELLEKLRLSPAEYSDAYPATLSGGQRQRVGLARAMAADQPVLLMDEPFGALDPVTRAHVRKDFKSLDELRQKTVILVTHDVSEALELGDRICLMDEGRVVQWGKPAELLLHPASDFVYTFFQENRLELELRVIRLGDVWPLLTADLFVNPNGSPSTPGSMPSSGAGPVLHLSDSLWEALQKTNEVSGDAIGVHGADGENGEDGAWPITGGALMEAFKRYKADQQNHIHSHSV